MRVISTYVISSVFLAAASMPVLADHPAVGFGAATAGPITTVGADVMAKGSYAIGVRSDSTSFDAFSDDQLIGFESNGIEHVHSVDSLQARFVGISYGITEKMTLGIRLPFVTRENIRAAHEEAPGGPIEAHNEGNSEGMGDMSAMAQFQYYNSGDLSSALLFGVNIATGKTDVGDVGGEFQPGTDTTVPMFGVAVTKKMNKLALHANALYILSSEGVDETDIGDRISYNAALAYRMSGGHSHAGGASEPHTDLNWDAIVELNGEMQKKATEGGVTQENSGGNTVFLTPGVRLTVNNKWAAYAAFAVPVAESLNGTQHETKSRFSFGIGVGF